MARKRKGTKTFIILLILLAIIASVILLVSFIKLRTRIPDNPAGTLGNTGGNLNNGGLFCQDGNTVYFSNPMDHGYIYSMDLDGRNQKLVMNVPAKYINSAGKYLYYNQVDGDTDMVYGFTAEVHGIYSYKKGSRNKTRGYDRTVAGVTTLIDNYVYYQHYDNDNGMTLYRTSLNGDDKGEVLDKIVNPCCVINGNIYYPDQDNYFLLNVFDTTTLTSAPFLNERMYNPVYSDNYIYYIGIGDDYPLCRLSLKDKSVERLTNDRVDCFNIMGDIIFYQRNSKDAPALMRMNRDGSGLVEIARGNYTDINMTSLYTYFHTVGEPSDLYRVSTAGSPSAESFIPAVIKKKQGRPSFQGN
ncbi:MAG: DUF5050 domain-containing protein [Lachnospiraceae bacterium]|nr:DUF5050 domain-containing protein [Lachnospiraceae bacterium]